jgi:hypothetical protein
MDKINIYINQENRFLNEQKRYLGCIRRDSFGRDFVAASARIRWETPQT